MSKYRTEIELERDDTMGEPWLEHDGHGPVSEWTTRDKEPGERVLCADRSMKRYYDYAGAIEMAKREGWDAPPYTGTKGERAARAVERDYEYLRAWCEDRWYWVGVIVKVYRDDELVGHDSLWGIDDEKYAHEEGERMAQYIIEEDTKKRTQAWREALATARKARADLDMAICYG